MAVKDSKIRSLAKECSIVDVRGKPKIAAFFLLSFKYLLGILYICAILVKSSVSREAVVCKVILFISYVFI